MKYAVCLNIDKINTNTSALLGAIHKYSGRNICTRLKYETAKYPSTDAIRRILLMEASTSQYLLRAVLNLCPGWCLSTCTSEALVFPACGDFLASHLAEALGQRDRAELGYDVSFLPLCWGHLSGCLPTAHSSALPSMEFPRLCFQLSLRM